MKIFAFEVYDYSLYVQEFFFKKIDAYKRALEWNYNDYQESLNIRRLIKIDRSWNNWVRSDGIKWQVKEYEVF